MYKRGVRRLLQAVSSRSSLKRPASISFSFLLRPARVRSLSPRPSPHLFRSLSSPASSNEASSSSSAGEKKVDESKKKKLPDLKALIRRLYLKVHPDLMERYPTLKVRHSLMQSFILISHSPSMPFHTNISHVLLPFLLYSDSRM